MWSAIFGSPGFGAANIIPTDMCFTASPLQVTVLLPCTLPRVNPGTLTPKTPSISAGVRSLQGSTCAAAGTQARNSVAATVMRRFIGFSPDSFFGRTSETSCHLFRQRMKLVDGHHVGLVLCRDLNAGDRIVLGHRASCVEAICVLVLWRDKAGTGDRPEGLDIHLGSHFSGDLHAFHRSGCRITFCPCDTQH